MQDRQQEARTVTQAKVYAMVRRTAALFNDYPITHTWRVAVWYDGQAHAIRSSLKAWWGEYVTAISAEVLAHNELTHGEWLVRAAVEKFSTMRGQAHEGAVLHEGEVTADEG